VVAPWQLPTHRAEGQMVGSVGLDPLGSQQSPPVDRWRESPENLLITAPCPLKGIQTHPDNSYTGFCLCLSGWREELACWKNGSVHRLYGLVYGALCD